MTNHQSSGTTSAVDVVKLVVPHVADTGGVLTVTGQSEQHELVALAKMHPTTGTSPYVYEPRRELGAFSDFVVEEMGSANERVRNGEMEPEELSERLESLSRSLSDCRLSRLLKDVGRRRSASLDLAFAERSLAIGYGSSPSYGEERRNWDL